MTGFLNTYRGMTIIDGSMTLAEVFRSLRNHGCLDLTEEINTDTCSPFPVCNGGSGDVYSGQLKNGTNVAVKVFRFHLVHEHGGKHLKYVARELHTWSKCNHPNILAMLGIVEFRGQVGMVSPWISRGNLCSYIRQQPDVDPDPLCSGICDGLVYLHEIGIIHGDLKGANVLISDDGAPLVTDFGNSFLNKQSLHFTGSMTNSAITPRWTAPEILDGLASLSYASDVFSLGMTLLEIITGKVPYHELEHAFAVITAILNKKLPTRPKRELPLSSRRACLLWTQLTECWEHDPKDRPTAAKVRDAVQSVLNFKDCMGMQSRFIKRGEIVGYWAGGELILSEVIEVVRPRRGSILIPNGSYLLTDLHMRVPSSFKASEADIEHPFLDSDF